MKYSHKIQDLIKEADSLIKRKDSVRTHEYISGLEGIILDLQHHLISNDVLYKTRKQQKSKLNINYEELVEYFTDVVWVEENGQLTYINKAFEIVFEMSREKVYRNLLAFFDKIHPEDIDRIKFSLQSDQELEFDYRIILSDKSIRHLQVKSFPVFNSNGTVGQRIGITKDVTDIRQNEASLIFANEQAEKKNKELAFFNLLLESSEKKYRQLFMDMGTAFALHEMVYDQKGRPIDYVFIEVNNAFEKITGLKRADIIGKSVLEVMPDTEKYWINTYARVARNGKSISFENYSKSMGKHFSVTAYSPAKHMFAIIFNDITDRKEREQLLKANEEKFRTIIENMPVALAVINFSGEFTQINQHFVHLFGYSLEEVNNLNSWMQLAYPNEEYRKYAMDLWFSDIQNAINNEKSIPSRMFRTSTRFGNVLDIELSFKLIEGKVLTIFSDLTERIRFEEELRLLNYDYQNINNELKESNEQIIKANQEISKAEERYRTILDTMAEGVMVINSDGRILSYNKASERILNICKEDTLINSYFLKDQYTIYENGEKYPFDLHPASLTLRTGEPQNNMVMGIIDINLPVTYISINTRPLFDTNTTSPYAVVVSFSDITNKKETENALKRNERVIKSMQEVISGTIGEKFFETMVLGLSESLNADITLIGELQKPDNNRIKTISICIDGQIVENVEYEAINTPCQNVIDQGNCSYTSHVEYLFPKSNFLRDFKINAYVGVPLYDSKGLKIGIMVAMYRNPMQNANLSETILQLFAGRTGAELERLEAEKELKIAKVKAEDSDRLKSAFLANMSHEIRTPMNGILGFANLIDNENLASEKRKKYINIINNSAQQLLAIISDILDISKIESGLLEIKKNPVKLNPLLFELRTQFRLDLKNRGKSGISLILNSDNLRRKIEIETDEVRFKQILSNLIGNAIKFTNQGMIEFGYHIHDKQTLVFHVRDTGIGISKDHLEIIFERFRQVDNDKMAVGTGLGLSISKGLIELLGGKIWVVSEVDKGTTFYFTLPASIDNKIKTRKNKQ